jgi:hypothetical protein
MKVKIFSYTISKEIKFLLLFLSKIEVLTKKMQNGFKVIFGSCDTIPYRIILQTYNINKLI